MHSSADAGGDGSSVMRALVMEPSSRAPDLSPEPRQSCLLAAPSPLAAFMANSTPPTHSSISSQARYKLADSELKQEAESLDFDHRELCPDEACTGILDDEGTCKECGAVDHPRAKRATSGVDLLHRTLCDDDTCIGILGPDGRCKECGHAGDVILSDPRLRGLKLSEADPIDDVGQPDEDEDQADDDWDEDDEDEDDDEDDDEDWDEEDDEDEDEEDDDDDIEPESDDPNFASRVLCSDGSCVGLVDAEGRCKECGLAVDGT